MHALIHTLWDRRRGRVKEISHLQVLAENAHSNLDSVDWKSVGWTASACVWQGLGTAPWFAAFKKNLYYVEAEIWKHLGLTLRSGHGNVKRRAVQNLYQSTFIYESLDVFVYPSLSERTGIYDRLDRLACLFSECRGYFYAIIHSFLNFEKICSL